MPWLLKTEPGTYSYDDLEREGKTVWDGVANPQAQKNLRAMSVGDVVFVYHTGEEKRVVGRAEVVRAAFPDVQIKAGARLPRPVTLADLKATPAFADSPLIKQGRLSVVPLTAAQAKVIDTRGAQ